MKNILFKMIIILALSVGIIQTSSAYYGYYHRPFRPYYYGPHFYCGPVFVPGHWLIDRWGYKVWIRPHYR